MMQGFMQTFPVITGTISVETVENRGGGDDETAIGNESTDGIYSDSVDGDGTIEMVWLFVYCKGELVFRWRFMFIK